MDQGAGPCGTLARETGPPASESSITWSVRVLWPALVEYYRTRDPNPYPKMGAKAGGGNGREALW